MNFDMHDIALFLFTICISILFLTGAACIYMSTINEINISTRNNAHVVKNYNVDLEHS